MLSDSSFVCLFASIKILLKAKNIILWCRIYWITANILHNSTEANLNYNNV